MIQPPLVLFFTVPTAYFLFHSSTIHGVKDVLINCGYPLIERFPLMFITSAVVLIVGMIRWYLATVGRRVTPVEAEADAGDLKAASKPKTARRTKTAGAAADTTLLDAVDATPPRRRRDHSIDRPSRAAAAAAAATASDEPPRRPRKASPAAGSSRSRHVRPPEPETEFSDPTTSRPRRRPAAQAASPIDPTAEPRRRPRPPQPREAREPRRNLPPSDGRSAYERPERLDRPLRSERPDRADRTERAERPERRRRPTSYDPYDSYEPRTTNGASGSHHPVSRVRYRGDDDAESRTEHRTRPRRPRGDADSWEFDV